MDSKCKFDDGGFCEPCKKHLNGHVKFNCALCDNLNIVIVKKEDLNIPDYHANIYFPYPDRVIACDACKHYIRMATAGPEEQIQQWDEYHESIRIDKSLYKVHCTCHQSLLYFQTFPGDFLKMTIEAKEDKEYDCEFETTYAVNCSTCNALGAIGFSKKEAAKLWIERYPKPFTPEDTPDALQSILDLFEKKDVDDEFGFFNKGQ